MPNVVLRVLFPKNRDRSGWLRVEIDGVPKAEFHALGRGSRGPGDTVFLKNGNTPTGTYSGKLESTKWWPKMKYGPNGAVALKPISGDALIAYSLYNRGHFPGRFLIHGGSLRGDEDYRGKGALKLTNGCIRLSNSDMKTLMGLLYGSTEDDSIQACTMLNVTVIVQEF